MGGRTGKQFKPINSRGLTVLGASNLRDFFPVEEDGSTAIHLLNRFMMVRSVGTTAENRLLPIVRTFGASHGRCHTVVRTL